jgi:hypothetical protein
MFKISLPGCGLGMEAILRLAPMQAALHSEFDVLATIHELLKDLLLPPEIQQVRGHQDDHKAYEDLPLPACTAKLRR